MWHLGGAATSPGARRCVGAPLSITTGTVEHRENMGGASPCPEPAVSQPLSLRNLGRFPKYLGNRSKKAKKNQELVEILIHPGASKLKEKSSFTNDNHQSYYLKKERLDELNFSKDQKLHKIFSEYENSFSS